MKRSSFREITDERVIKRLVEIKRFEIGRQREIKRTRQKLIERESAGSLPLRPH